MGYGFTFNGTHTSVHGVIMKSVNRQVLPESNDTYIDIPGRNGSYISPGELADRIISLQCTVVLRSLESLRLKVRDISAWLYAEERKPLIFDDEPGKMYMAKVEGSIDLEQIFALGRFDLTFRCEPLVVGEEVAESFVSDMAAVENEGTYEAMPVFSVTFTDAASEWKVTLGTQYIRVVHDFQVDDTLEINCETGAVLLNGGRALDKLDWQNSQFFGLPPGESTLTILPAGKCTADISFRPRWL